ncbi:MAG: hypothetical protein H6617_10845 [Bdellovibrionaceae bacterium]|nr:hypothetical protein [Bdellovibrionales bacterium]MCB9255169.1 hypothetical protein [Pseudobdellovibrionaceae bacterium]
MKNIFILFTLLLAVAPTFASDWDALRRARQEFADEDEDGADLCADTLAAIGDHADLFLVLGKADPNVFQHLWDSTPFQTFLTDTERPVVGEYPEDDPEAIKDYLDLRLPEFNAGRELEKKQAASLKESMILRGAKPGRKGGYAALAALSAENRDRLLAAHPYAQGTPGMEQAEALVAKLGLLYTHNAPRAVQTPKYSLLSSAALAGLGFPGGLNTSEFNRWLKSDEGVFFFVDPYVERSSGRLVASQANAARQRYGEYQFELDSKYADKRAWISLYVMDVDELIAFAKVVHPKQYQDIVTLLNETYHYDFEARRSMPFEELMEFANGGPPEKAWEFVRRTRGLEPKLLDLRHSLHRLDFSPADFRMVIRQTLLCQLNSMRLNQPPQFSRAVEILAEGDAREFRRLLNDEVFTILGIPNEYELKVPVAVPVQGMRVSAQP